jgi:hypothetical protein
MTQPFLALITPLTGDGGGGGSGNVPTHPIVTPPTGKPPGIWGGPPLYPDQGLPGPQPRPEHPITLPPYEPGGPPVQIWPSPGHPSHPIVIPPPPPPPAGEAVKPPPEGGGWGYAPNAGWGYFPAQGQPGPK